MSIQCSSIALRFLVALFWLQIAFSHVQALPPDRFLISPQWWTGPRLLKLGESIEFNFFLPEDSESKSLGIFPRYLEEATPGLSFNAQGDLSWLAALPSESLPLKFSQRVSTVNYTPKKTGNYLARWRVGEETLYRYFAVIDDRYVVTRFGGYYELPLLTSLHATGIPMDFPLPMAKFECDDELYDKFNTFHRVFGDSIVPQLPDTPNLSENERYEPYKSQMEHARGLLIDPSDERTARIAMWHANEPGYARVLARLGVNSHFGLQMANGGSWLGMPEFPYFVSPLDIRKVNQNAGGSLVTHQWDFCGGWHFLGPQSWHYAISHNN